jgi:NADH dehydrogenase
MREETYVLYLLPIRLFAGWAFFMESLSKLSSGWLERPRLQGLLEGFLREGKPYSFYVPFMKNVLLVHPTFFTYLVIVLELVVGAALLAGLFTRLASLGGLFLVLNFLLARGDGAGPNPTAPFIAILLTLFFTHSGRTLGLDAALRDKVPRWLT